MSLALRDLAWDYVSRPDLKLPAQSEVLLLAMAERVNDRGVVWVGEHTVAKWVGRSRAWVRRHRGPLVAAGLLGKLAKSSPGIAARWQLFPNDLSIEVLPDEAATAMASQARESSRRKAQWRRLQGNTVVPEVGGEEPLAHLRAQPDTTVLQGVGTRHHAEPERTEEPAVVEHLREQKGDGYENEIASSLEEAVEWVLEGFEGAVLVG